LPVPRLAIDGKIISPPSRNMGFLRFGLLHLHEALTSFPVIRFTMGAIQPTSSGMPRPALFVPWLSIRFRGVGLPGAGGLENRVSGVRARLNARDRSS
jgi:hypothetical protein